MFPSLIFGIALYLSAFWLYCLIFVIKPTVHADEWAATRWLQWMTLACAAAWSLYHYLTH